LSVLLVGKEEKKFVREEEKGKEGGEAVHYIEKQTWGDHPSAGMHTRSRRVHSFDKRKQHMTQYESLVNTDIGETPTESNVRSIS